MNFTLLLSKEAIFLPGRICLWQEQSYLLRQVCKFGSGRAGPEVLSQCPASRSDTLIPNHNNPTALLGRRKVWFVAPWLVERTKPV